MDVTFWAPVLVGGFVAGASSGLLGTYIVGMRLPFLGVCVAHAALAGAVFGELAGLSGSAMLLPALGGAMVAALVLGLMDPRRLPLDPNVVMGFLFSASMGLAFLGLGLFSVLGRSDHHARSLLWGSLTFCRWNDVAWMLVVGLALGVFLLLFYKEMRAILFSREDAAALGIRTTLVWTLFLVLTAAVLTVNLQTVGGLMIYSLMTNPAAAAFLLVRGHARVALWSAGLGAASAVGGFLIAAFTDLPTGAVIVLCSSGVVLLAALLRKRTIRGG
jgi:manganese/iron transport system permease protein